MPWPFLCVFFSERESVCVCQRLLITCPPPCALSASSASSSAPSGHARTCVRKRGNQRMASPVTHYARAGEAGCQSSLIGLRAIQRRVKSMNSLIVVLIVAVLLVGASLHSQSYVVRIIVKPPATSCLHPPTQRKQLDEATWATRTQSFHSIVRPRPHRFASMRECRNLPIHALHPSPIFHHLGTPGNVVDMAAFTEDGQGSP